MTTGAIVGIAVGAALLFLGSIALFWAYHRKQKNIYNSDFTFKYDPRGGGASVKLPIRGIYDDLDSKSSSALSHYELKTQGQSTNNADDHTGMGKDTAMRQANYHFDPIQAMRGPSSALPVHPAYVPRALSRSGTREPSPDLSAPAPVRSNRPDECAMSLYLDASSAPRFPSMEASHLMPAGPSTASAYDPSAWRAAVYSQQGSYRSSHGGSLPQPTWGRDPSPNRGLTHPLLPGAPPPPPPPRVPKLDLPSVPKLRARKFQPPQIIVEDATPIAGPGESVPISLDISNPLIPHRQRFTNETAAGIGSQPVNPPADLPQQYSGQVAPRSTANRRETYFHDIETIHTGKSTVFG
jgi:hypothetical protein